MRVQVTRADIKKGSGRHGPIARALGRALGVKVNASVQDIRFTIKGSRYVWILPADLHRWSRRFDYSAGTRSSPVSFDFDRPSGP
jgi:hypothetical protein